MTRFIVRDDKNRVKAGEKAKQVAESKKKILPHDCYDHAVPYVSDGKLKHGWECGLCGKFLQAG